MKKEDSKKNNLTKPTRKKTINRKTNKKKIQSKLSNEELLEQIISKKNTKKRIKNKKQVPKELSNEELLEQIMSKKKTKQAKTKKAINKEVNNKIVKKIVENDEAGKTTTSSDIIDAIELPKLKEKKSDNTRKKIDNIEEAVGLYELTKALLEEENIRKKENTKRPKNITLKRQGKKSKPVKKEPIKIISSSTTKKQNHKKTKRHVRKSALIVISLFCALLFIIAISFTTEKSNVSDYNKQEEDENVEIQRQEKKYNECLKRAIDNKDNSEEIALYLEELDNYMSKYKVSVSYEDLNLGYSYIYNPSEDYYAASTIKSLDALYIYTKASNNELSLDDTVKYSKKFKWGESAYMKNVKYGTNVTLRDLVKYAVTVSDNSAHQMLISYIGYSNLKEFALQLGAKKTLSGYDNFGYIDINDAMIYMKELYKFFNNNTELGAELKQVFLTADQNDLAIPEQQIEAAHKYGEYNEIYHDIGIVYDKNPYAIAILTKEGTNNYREIVKDINLHIYKLHTLYNNNRINVCKQEVYEN